MLRQAHEGLLTSTFGEQVKQRYLVFARAVDAYNTHLYLEWEQRVGAVATEKLKQPILCALATTRGLLDSTPDANMHGKIKAPGHQQAPAPMDSKNSGMPLPPYGVNFATELHMIIRESKYLDRMGFQVGMRVLDLDLLVCMSGVWLFPEQNCLGLFFNNATVGSGLLEHEA